MLKTHQAFAKIKFLRHQDALLQNESSYASIIVILLPNVANADTSPVSYMPFPLLLASLKEEGKRHVGSRTWYNLFYSEDNLVTFVLILTMPQESLGDYFPLFFVFSYLNRAIKCLTFLPFFWLVAVFKKIFIKRKDYLPSIILLTLQILSVIIRLMASQGLFGPLATVDATIGAKDKMITAPSNT